jgi:hypothetical protein
VILDVAEQPRVAACPDLGIAVLAMGRRRHLTPELGRQRLHAVAAAEHRASYAMEMATQWVMARAEERGMRVDLEYARGYSAELTERADTLRAKVEDADGIFPGSAAQVAAVLLGDGIPPVEKTKISFWRRWHPEPLPPDRGGAKVSVFSMGLPSSTSGT